jgi:hypothetical protein
VPAEHKAARALEDHAVEGLPGIRAAYVPWPGADNGLREPRARPTRVSEIRELMTGMGNHPAPLPILVDACAMPFPRQVFEEDMDCVETLLNTSNAEDGARPPYAQGGDSGCIWDDGDRAFLPTTQRAYRSWSRLAQ